MRPCRRASRPIDSLGTVVKAELAFGARLASESERASALVDAFCEPLRGGMGEGGGLSVMAAAGPAAHPTSLEASLDSLPWVS